MTADITATTNPAPNGGAPMETNTLQQNPLTGLRPVSVRPSSAFGHIKSRYWNKEATKGIHIAIRNHFKQHASLRSRCLLQAM